MDSGQTMTSSCVVADISEGCLGDVEDAVLVVRSGQLHHHLAGIDILACFRADGGDHAVEIGLELGVVELVAGEIEIGLGSLEPRLGGLQVLQRGVVGRLRRPAVLQKLGLARLRSLRIDERRLGGADVRFRRAQAVLIVLRVERRQRVALLDRSSDIHEPGEHLAGDAERQIALVSRLDLADRLAVFADGFGIDDERADQPEFRRRVLWLAAGKHQQKREKKDAGPHVSGSKNRLNVDVDNFIAVKVVNVNIALGDCGMPAMQNVDIANLDG